ncbi:MAG: SGNH/GDSL hydrolase family protein [Gemmatimonadetes bacterium]|nr:SGNH/GDSL hydrolase family protein [Gemmatimonadota bacterium]
MPRMTCVVFLHLAAIGCLDATTRTPPRLDEADHRILFIGNSLTYTNDLPGAVATVAGALGHDVAVASVARPNFALEDHWFTGIAAVINDLAPDVVVMQQGPSSLPENQEHLALWADSLSGLVRDVGGEPALLMVWPSLSRSHAFDDVRDAYMEAAERVDGHFFPAGEALRALHDSYPEFSPYGSDGFHPSDYGTVVAAYVLVSTYFEETVSGLPGRLEAANDGRVVDLLLDEATALQTVADSVVAAWR